MQLGVEPVMRGRVMALYMAVFFGGTPIGAPLVGAVAEAFGPRWSLIIGGGISAGAAAVAGLVLARHQGIEIRGQLRDLPPSRVRVADRVETVHQA
jgi:MFS family permease